MPFAHVGLTVRRMMVAVAVCGFAIACYVWIMLPAFVFVGPAPPPESASPDHEIFDIVLLDLIDNEEFSPMTGGRGVKKSQIVFGDTTAGWGGIMESSVYHIRNRNQKIPPDVEDDLRRRNRVDRNTRGKRFSLAGYHPSNSNILLRALDQVDRDFLTFGGQFPNARGYVYAVLPGYSRDGREAVILFAFGPNEHAAVGCYSLKRVNGRWEIVWREILQYT